MKQRYEKVADPYERTLTGFIRDLSIASSFHGVRVLMKKHFPVVEEVGEHLKVKTGENEYLVFDCFCRKEEKVKVRACECFYIWKGKSGEEEKLLIWQQLRKGKEPFEPATYYRHKFMLVAGIPELPKEKEVC